MPEAKAGRNRLDVDVYPLGLDDALPTDRRVHLVESLVAELWPQVDASTGGHGKTIRTTRFVPAYLHQRGVGRASALAGAPLPEVQVDIDRPQGHRFITEPSSVRSGHDEVPC